MINERIESLKEGAKFQFVEHTSICQKIKGCSDSEFTFFHTNRYMKTTAFFQQILVTVCSKSSVYPDKKYMFIHIYMCACKALLTKRTKRHSLNKRECQMNGKAWHYSSIHSCQSLKSQHMSSKISKRLVEIWNHNFQQQKSKEQYHE